MVRDQVRNQILDARIINRNLGKVCNRGAWVRANVWFLAGEKFGVNAEAVLEIINAEPRGFVESDGTEVAGEFQPALMGGFDGGAELGASEIVVSLERGCAVVGPEAHEVARVFRAGERVHL